METSNTFALRNTCSARRAWVWSSVASVAACSLLAGACTARADTLDLSAPQTMAQLQPPATPPAAVRTDGIANYFANWFVRSDAARASQPDWSTPLNTTSAVLTQRVRYDAVW